MMKFFDHYEQLPLNNKEILNKKSLKKNLHVLKCTSFKKNITFLNLMAEKLIKKTVTGHSAQGHLDPI